MVNAGRWRLHLAVAVYYLTGAAFSTIELPLLGNDATPAPPLPPTTSLNPAPLPEPTRLGKDSESYLQALNPPDLTPPPPTASTVEQGHHHHHHGEGCHHHHGAATAGQQRLGWASEQLQEGALYPVVSMEDWMRHDGSHNKTWTNKIGEWVVPQKTDSQRQERVPLYLSPEIFPWAFETTPVTAGGLRGQSERPFLLRKFFLGYANALGLSQLRPMFGRALFEDPAGSAAVIVWEKSARFLESWERGLIGPRGQVQVGFAFVKRRTREEYPRDGDHAGVNTMRTFQHLLRVL